MRLLPGILAEANGSPLGRSKSSDARRHSDPWGAETFGGDPSFEEGKLANEVGKAPRSVSVPRLEEQKCF